MFTSATLDQFRVPVMCYESSDGFGLVGYVDFWQECFNTNCNTVNSSSTLAIINGSATQPCFVLPWSGSAPGTVTATRTGRTF
jgi:hypothetical protein